MIRRALLLLLLCVTGASAQGISPAVLDALAGSWLLVPRDGTAGCRVTLRTDAVIGGYGLTLAPDCARKMPVLADVAGWHPMDGLKLINALRRTVIAFREHEDGQYDAPEPSPGYALVRAPDHVTRLPLERDAFGTWAMRRPGGEVICRVQLTDQVTPGGQESYVVRVLPGCQGAVTRLNLVSWRVEMLKLMLYGPEGTSLGFVQAPEGFTKAPDEGGRPLLLERVR